MGPHASTLSSRETQLQRLSSELLVLAAEGVADVDAPTAARLRHERGGDRQARGDRGVRGERHDLGANLATMFDPGVVPTRKVSEPPYEALCRQPTTLATDLTLSCRDIVGDHLVQQVAGRLDDRSGGHERGPSSATGG